MSAAGRAFHRLERLVIWGPAILAALYLLQLLRTLGTVRDSLASHADFASAPVIAELMTGRPDASIVTLGDYRWYEALWLLRGTKWLPSHEVVWEFVPFVLWALLVGAIFVAVRRVSTPWAARTAAALVICGGVGMRSNLWSLNTHGPVSVHVAVLGLALVLLASARGRPRFGRWAVISAVPVIAFTAFGATDPLVLGSGVAPFLVASLGLAYRTRDRAAAIYGVVVAGASAVGGMILVGLGDAYGYEWTHRYVSFVAPDKIFDQAQLIVPALGQLVARSTFAERIDATTAFSMAGGLVALVALVVVLRGALRAAWATFDPHAPRPDDPLTVTARRAAATDAFVLFWAAVATLTLLQFVFTSAAIDLYGGRYIVAAWIAVCALLPVLAERAGRTLAASAAASVIAIVALGLSVMNPKPTRDEPYPTKASVAPIVAFAREHGVTSGYAGFWTAMAATWQSRFAIELYPVTQCLGPDYPKNCALFQHQISSWYTAGDRGRRMLVVDGRLPISAVLDPHYGKPVAQQQFDTTTVYIFDHDLSSQIG